MSASMFRSLICLLLAPMVSFPLLGVGCPLDPEAIAAVRNGVEWFAFWINHRVASEYQSGRMISAAAVVSPDRTLVFLESPKLEFSFDKRLGRLKLVSRYQSKSPQVAAAEFLEVLKTSSRSHLGCIEMLGDRKTATAKPGAPAGNVLPLGRLCPPGGSAAEELRLEFCEFVSLPLRLATYPNTAVDPGAQKRLVDAVRSEVRQLFVGDRVQVTIPISDAGDPEVLVLVESPKYRSRGLLPMHPRADGGWDPSKFIYHVPKNNIGALIEKVKQYTAMRMELP